MTIIRSVETFVLRIDRGMPADSARFLASPRVRSIYPSRDETLLVRIATDEHVGWGEALAPASPEAPAALIDHVFASFLVGADLAAGVRALSRALQQTGRERGHLAGIQSDALAAVDTALWDLLGKHRGLPVHQLVGGRMRESIPVYLSEVRGADGEAKAEVAVAALAEGVTRFKLHLVGTPAEALAEYDVVRERLAAADAVGGAGRDATGRVPVEVALDAHWVHSLGEAQRLAAGLREREAWFLEAPLAPEDMAGHASLVSTAGVPIALGEAMRHRFEFRGWADALALGIAQPDIGRTGITEGLAIATALEARHVPIAPHHSMATGVAYAAALQVCAAADDVLALEWGPRMMERSEEFLVTAPLDLVRDAQGRATGGGEVAVPTAPGLGIEVDEDAVRALAARG